MVNIEKTGKYKFEPYLITMCDAISGFDETNRCIKRNIMQASSQYNVILFGRLSLRSFIKIGLFIGLGSGLMSIPIYLIVFGIRATFGAPASLDMSAARLLNTLVITPIGSVVGVLISALLAYPVYLLYCHRKGGHSLSGFFQW